MSNTLPILIGTRTGRVVLELNIDAKGVKYVAAYQLQQPISTQ